MKTFTLHLFVVLASLALIYFGWHYVDNGNNYFDFLLSNYVLNPIVIVIGLILGYTIKNYLIVFYGATFVLAVYVLVFVSNLFDVFAPLFLAIYTVSLLAMTVGNLMRHFKEWLLIKA